MPERLSRRSTCAAAVRVARDTPVYRAGASGLSEGTSLDSAGLYPLYPFTAGWRSEESEGGKSAHGGMVPGNAWRGDRKCQKHTADPPPYRATGQG